METPKTTEDKLRIEVKELVDALQLLWLASSELLNNMSDAGQESDDDGVVFDDTAELQHASKAAYGLLSSRAKQPNNPIL